MRQFFNQPAGQQQRDYAERSEPFGHAYQAASAPRGINRHSALCPLCRYRHKTHWTGHPTRLARDLSNRFGSEGYAREELVAEIASAFLCAKHSIQPTVRHADYIGNWLTILKNDNRAVFQAASMASKAADFLLAFNNQSNTEQAA
jgi:antirestriction protein ArdC